MSHGRYALPNHPALHEALVDVLWIEGVLRATQRDDDVTVELFDQLKAVARAKSARFWERLYALTPLHAGQHLELSLEDGTPVVIIHDDDTDDDDDEDSPGATSRSAHSCLN